MRIAIITENFLPKLDGVTRTLAKLLEHLQLSGHKAMLLGPESGMEEYAGAAIIGTAGLPLPFYPELKFNFFRLVGRVSWEKNLRLLVQAYRKLNDQHCHLVIVGEGPALDELRQELADVPVTFTGYLAGEALAVAYATADIFAFPSALKPLVRLC